MFTFSPLTLDLSTSHAIQAVQPDWLTAIMKWVSVLTSPELLIIVCILLAIYAYRHHHVTRAALVLILTVGNLLSLVLKHFFDRPRPTADVVHVLVRESDRSFPSGHAIAIVIFGMVTVAIWWRFLTRGGRWFLVVVMTLAALLVGYSRLYLGVHWMTDILGGYIVGLIWSAITFLIVGPFVQTKTKR